MGLYVAGWGVNINVSVSVRRSVGTRTALFGCKFDGVERGFSVPFAGPHKLGDLRIGEDIEVRATECRRQVRRC